MLSHCSSNLHMSRFSILSTVNWIHSSFMRNKVGLPWWLSRWRILLQRRRHRFSPWVRRSPGGRNGNSFQYSCLKNPREGAWQATVQRVAKNWTWLSKQYLFYCPKPVWFLVIWHTAVDAWAILSVPLYT